MNGIRGWEHEEIGLERWVEEVGCYSLIAKVNNMIWLITENAPIEIMKGMECIDIDYRAHYQMMIPS
jgi:hypothetical protein